MNDTLSGGGAGQTPVHPDDLEGLRQRWVTTQGQIDELERLNVLEGRRWMDRPRQVQALLDDVYLRELHRRMFGRIWSWAGTYRTRATSIGIEANQIAPAVRDLLLDAGEWFRVSTPADALIALAQLHHRLVFIHPFANGNGRVARAYTEVIARSITAPVPTWGIGTDDGRDHYLAALRAADAGDLTPLVAFMWS